MNELIRYMHELSLDYYEHAWEHDLEKLLWLALKGDSISLLRPEERRKLQRLVDEAQAWPELYTPAEYADVYSLSRNSYDPSSYFKSHTIPEWEAIMMEDLL